MIKNLVSLAFLFLSLTASMTVCRADEQPANQSKVPLKLQAGATFDRSNIPEQSIQGWYRIPAWFAGATIRTETVSPDGRVQKSVRRRERGRQLDAKGHIWEARREPISYDIDEDKIVVHTIIEEEVPLSVAKQQVVMEYHLLMIIESKSNHVISDSYRTIQTHIFTPQADGSIHCEIEKSFYYKANGTFRNAVIHPADYVEHKTATFKPVDSDEKFDYKDSFIRFLQSTNRSDLIP